jgi:hypothetical protein
MQLVRVRGADRPHLLVLGVLLGPAGDVEASEYVERVVCHDQVDARQLEAAFVADLDVEGHEPERAEVEGRERLLVLGVRRVP